MTDGDTTGWGSLANSAIYILVLWDLFYESLLSSLILGFPDLLSLQCNLGLITNIDTKP